MKFVDDDDDDNRWDATLHLVSSSHRCRLLNLGNATDVVYQQSVQDVWAADVI